MAEHGQSGQLTTLRLLTIKLLDKKSKPSKITGSLSGNSSVVEHNLAKVGVASSSLVSRSNFIESH